MSNVDLHEIEKFSQLAHKWWDTQSEFKPLHDMNPLRLQFIQDHCPLTPGLKVLDVGCGGGILSEAMAQSGADVTGIDLAKKSLQVAQLHSLDCGIEVNYRCISVEDLAQEAPESFDLITCMEMLEHVPDPHSIVNALARLVKPGGWVILSTLNRNPKSYTMAILGAEYLLNLLPRGTHDYEKFIKPSELARICRHANLTMHSLKGMHYNPINKTFSIAKDTDVNYLMACQRI